MTHVLLFRCALINSTNSIKSLGIITFRFFTVIVGHLNLNMNLKRYEWFTKLTLARIFCHSRNRDSWCSLWLWSIRKAKEWSKKQNWKKNRKKRERWKEWKREIERESDKQMNKIITRPKCDWTTACGQRNLNAERVSEFRKPLY